MKLLFIQGGSRVRVCDNNTYYVDGNFNNQIFERYKSYCDNLTVILRKVDKVFDEKDLCNRFNKINTDILDLILVDDVYSPKKNYMNIIKRKKISKVIEEEVFKSDKVIIRSIGNIYTNLALYFCKKYKKKYLIEVTGFAFEGLWYHSFFGKVAAIPRELKVKKELKIAPYAVYVTEKALQERYPCNGASIGCSDVEISEVRQSILERRLARIQNYNKNTTLKIGTAAFLDVKWKGQHDLIKALYKIKKLNICNFNYELIGARKWIFFKTLNKKI